MRCINAKENKITIQTNITTCRTKNISKDGTEKYNIKYRAFIPIDILTLLIARHCSKAGNVEENNNNMCVNELIEQGNIYLSFAETTRTDQEFIIDVVKEKKENCFIIKKLGKTNAYYFTLSKRLFNLLKISNRDDFIFKYSICFDGAEWVLNNCVVGVALC